MMSEKYVRAARPFFPKEDIGLLLRDIAVALEEGRLRNGKNLSIFERMFAEYIGVKDAVAVDSDGSALETALQYHRVKGREVIVCTNSFIAIPNSVVYAGGKVVFADIRPETLSMDPKSLLEGISGKTCGVIVTHIAGFPNPDLKEIVEICRDRDIFLIEDATHAIGAMIDGRKVGTFGDAAIFTFTPTKVMTTGEGGMLATNNTRLIEEARRFRYYGAGEGRTNFVHLGRHMLLPEISAILGIYQLKRIEEFIVKRNEIARIYDEELGRMDSAKIVECSPSSRASYYKYPLILDHNVDRQEFAELLERKYRIETGTVFYPPCHIQPVYQRLKNRLCRGNPSVSERVLSRTITLPIHAAMKDDDAEYVADSACSLLSIISRGATTK